MDYFLTVAQQVLILFVLIAVGFVLAKTNVMTDTGAKVCSDIALFVATPCVIINSFRREVTADTLWGLLAALGAALLIHALGIGVALLLYRKKTEQNIVLRLCTVLSNAGFMALPLQQAILGDTGVFYGAAYVVMFNLVLWSYGPLTMDRASTKLSWKKMLLNPGMIGLVVGVIVMLLPVELPAVVTAPLTHLGNLNTPLPMLFIGHYLSKVNFKQALRRPAYFVGSAVRLLLVPGLSAAVLYLMGIRGDLLVSMTVAASAPVAAGVAMFTTRYDRDTETAVNMVALSTVFSLITMPLLVSVVQTIA